MICFGAHSRRSAPSRLSASVTPLASRPTDATTERFMSLSFELFEPLYACDAWQRCANGRKFSSGRGDLPAQEAGFVRREFLVDDGPVAATPHRFETPPPKSVLK